MAPTLTHERAPVQSEVLNEFAPLDHRSLALRSLATLLVAAMSQNPPRPISLSIVYEPVESGWIQARIEGIPEVITAGPSKAEARSLVLDALREYLLSIRDERDVADRELVDLLVRS
jgi:hypothetical protein